jgi:hypothetical protein
MEIPALPPNGPKQRRESTAILAVELEGPQGYSLQSYTTCHVRGGATSSR